MNDACSSGAGAGPPPSKRLRLSRNRHVCSGGSSSGRRTRLESLELHRTLGQRHHPHLDLQHQPRAAAAAGWLFEKDQLRVGDVRPSKASHSNQRAHGASLSCCREGTRLDPLSGETCHTRVHDRDPGPAEQSQLLGDKPAAEFISASSNGPEQTFSSQVSRCQHVDTEEEEGEVLEGAEADDRYSKCNAGSGGGAVARGQQHEEPFESETAESNRTAFANSSVLGHEGQKQVMVDDARGSGTPAHGKLLLCSSSYGPVAGNVVDHNAAASSLSLEVSPVEGDPSCLELVHQIVRDLGLVHQIVREVQDHPCAPESSSDGLGFSTGAAVERVNKSHCEGPVSTGEDTSILRTSETSNANEVFPGNQHHHTEFQLVPLIVREEQDHSNAPESSFHERGCSTSAAVEQVHGNSCESPASTGEDTSFSLQITDGNGFPGSQHHHTESGLNPARSELASEGRLPFASNQPLVDSPADGALTSSEENRTAEDIAANILTRIGDLAGTNEVYSTDLQQMITEDQLAIGPDSINTSLPSEGGVLPGMNQQMVGNRVEIVESTEDDITAGDVVNILSRTGRIVRAIEAYSRSPDHRTTEDHVDAGVNILNTGLQSEVQLTSRPNQQMVELTSEVVESSREVTAEDVANIYAQAGAIAQAANNWFALSESARNRAIENININANWGSLVQENVPREAERLGENRPVDDKRPIEAADPSGLQSQEPNAPDGLSCPICMEPWTNTGEHRICSLACGHLFGKSCIKRWIKQGGRRIGKCPHCNKRAKVEDLRNIYVPHIAVSDGHNQEVVQEVKRVRSENEELKRMNAELHLEMARLQLEMDRLRHVQVMAAGAGILQKEEHSRSDEAVNARKRQSQLSLQTFFGRNDRRRSRRNCDEHWLDGRHSKVHMGTGGHRSSSSVACIGNRGLGENFILQDEIHLLGAKVFDMEDHSQMALVSNKASTHGSNFGLTKISLLTLSEVQHVNLPPGVGAIRDVRFSPFGIGTPGKLALVASLGKRLSLFSLESNSIVLDYPLQSAPWSCAWDSGVPNQVYAGLQNGSLLIFDLRQTSSPMASFPGTGTRPVHTLQAVQSQTRKGILSASNSGAYFWDMGSSASFTEIQRPLCISDDHREKLCVSLAYAPCLRTAVASFRPSPLAQREASSSAPSSSQADNITQPCGTLRRSLEPSSSSTQQTTTQDSPSHCIFSSRFEDSSSQESTDGGKGSRRKWRWESGKAMMVGHKSVSVMPRSTVIVEPVDDGGLRASFACGDEGTNAVWLWDMNTLNVTQTLVPHQSPVLDVKYVNIGERIFMGCISERTFQLYRRLSTP